MAAEISQVDLIHLARAIYVARADKANETLASLANRALDALMTRRTDAKKRIGSDDPLLLATVFLESLTDEEYAASTAKLDGLRLLPLDRHVITTRSGTVDAFPQILAFCVRHRGLSPKCCPKRGKRC